MTIQFLVRVHASRPQGELALAVFPKKPAPPHKTPVKRRAAAANGPHQGKNAHVRVLDHRQKQTVPADRLTVAVGIARVWP